MCICDQMVGGSHTYVPELERDMLLQQEGTSPNIDENGKGKKINLGRCVAFDECLVVDRWDLG